jgi:hypothetical protein
VSVAGFPTDHMLDPVSCGRCGRPIDRGLFPADSPHARFCALCVVAMAEERAMRAGRGWSRRRIGTDAPKERRRHRMT